jgi:NADPH:quinone reductase
VRAVVIHRFGPPGVLGIEQVPDPVPGPGQALVRVEVVNITFIETQIRAGRAPGAMLRPLPMVPGNGVGGAVAAVGDGVDPALVGRAVVAVTGGSGGYAELAAVPVEELIAVPDGLAVTDAVALLADGRTALALTAAAAPAAGDRILVSAAGGGLGSLLVQLGHRAGARVVGAAGGPAKLALARRLGAIDAVDYSVPGWGARVRELTGGVDLVFDGVGGEFGKVALDLVADGGRYCVHGAAGGAMTELPAEELDRRRIRAVSLGSVPRDPVRLRELARTALAEAAAGRLVPTVGQTFPLDRAAEAHAAIESRATLGKTLLIV